MTSTQGPRAVSARETTVQAGEDIAGRLTNVRAQLRAAEHALWQGAPDAAACFFGLVSVLADELAGVADACADRIRGQATAPLFTR